MPAQSTLEFEGIGTTWRISLPDSIARDKSRQLEDRIRERIDIFDKDYSRFRPDSLVTKMSQKAGEYQLSADAESMLSLYEKIYRLTNGAVTPMIGQTLSDAGYDAQYSLKPGPLSRPPAWDDILEFNFPILTIKEPVLLDFGAAGKGYLIDIIAQLLEDQGIKEYCVDAGGDMAYKGIHSLRVGLEDPDDVGRVIGVAEIKDQSLCGSAGNRRAWRGFHHIMDPHALSSPRHLKAVWTTAASTLMADMASTALFFVAGAYLRRHFDFEYLLLKADGTIERSEAFPAEIFYD